MKTGFEYYYRPNKAEVDTILKNGTFFFDTNILLDVFRVEKKSAQTLIKVFEYLKGRVKLPYHVVEEYHSDYLSVLVQQKVYLQNAITSLKDKEKGLLSFVNGKDYSKLSKYAKTILRQALDKANKSVIVSYNNTIKHLESEIQNDILINKLSEVFSSCVLPALSQEELETIYTEGLTLYPDEVPPGFKDANKDKKGILKNPKSGTIKDDSQNVFGDLVIWREILKYASANNVDVVFVSNDVKDDWICEICNEKHGPRIELLEEFYKKTGGHRILIYSFEQFVLKLNAIEKYIPESELKTAISSLDEPWRRDERFKNRVLKEYSYNEEKSNFEPRAIKGA